MAFVIDIAVDFARGARVPVGHVTLVRPGHAPFPCCVSTHNSFARAGNRAVIDALICSLAVRLGQGLAVRNCTRFCQASVRGGHGGDELGKLVPTLKVNVMAVPRTDVGLTTRHRVEATGACGRR